MNRDAGPFDDAVVGAGIVGLAVAYALARRGRRVLVVERGDRAEGASVRNFGMLWPIGQPIGPARDRALHSLAIWADVLPRAGLWHEAVGSLHLAYRDDEAAVLREFFEREADPALEMLSPAAVLDRAPGVVPDGLSLGLFSPREVCVDPREVVAGLPGWLATEHGVRFEFATAASDFEPGSLTAGGRPWRAGRLWVCAGDDFRTLYPAAFADAGLVRCKLQMMRTAPVAGGWRLGPMLAAGLTLRHYRSFEGLPTLDALRSRIAAESPEFDRWGIHVMAAQNGRGEVVLGDSHEYDEAIAPFDRDEIDAAILRYLNTFLAVPGLHVAHRWHGTYAKHPENTEVVLRPAEGVVAIAGVGGAGMTLSFGLADRLVAEELGGG